MCPFGSRASMTGVRKYRSKGLDVCPVFMLKIPFEMSKKQSSDEPEVEASWRNPFRCGWSRIRTLLTICNTRACRCHSSRLQHVEPETLLQTSVKKRWGWGCISLMSSDHGLLGPHPHSGLPNQTDLPGVLKSPWEEDMVGISAAEYMLGTPKIPGSFAGVSRTMVTWKGTAWWDPREILTGYRRYSWPTVDQWSTSYVWNKLEVRLTAKFLFVESHGRAGKTG